MKDKNPEADLEDLDDRLKRARREGKSGNPATADGAANQTSGFAMAMRVGAELVSALIVGVGIGLLLDNWLDTGPWFLVVFFFLGAGAGVLNVYRTAGSMAPVPGYRQDSIDK